MFSHSFAQIEIQRLSSILLLLHAWKFDNFFACKMHMREIDDDDNFMSLLLNGKQKKLPNGTAAVQFLAIFLSPHVERINSISDFYTTFFAAVDWLSICSLTNTIDSLVLAAGTVRE